MWRRLASQACRTTVRFAPASAGRSEGGDDERRKAVVRTRAQSGCSNWVAQAAPRASGLRFDGESVRIRKGATIPQGARRRRLLRLRTSVTFTGTKGAGTWRGLEDWPLWSYSGVAPNVLGGAGARWQHLGSSGVRGRPQGRTHLMRTTTTGESSTNTALRDRLVFEVGVNHMRGVSCHGDVA